MRISDSERCEVAENLRSLDDEAKVLIVEQMRKLTYEEIDGGLVLILGLLAAVDAAGLEMKQSGNFWDLLADLIDRPTCEMKSIPKTSYRVCSRCGAFVRKDAVTDCTEVIPVRFCPNCDARVVRGDE